MRPKYIILLGYSSRSPYCYRAGSRLESRGVHGDGEDWDPMGPMGMGIRSAMGWEWDGNGN